MARLSFIVNVLTTFLLLAGVALSAPAAAPVPKAAPYAKPEIKKADKASSFAYGRHNLPRAPAPAPVPAPAPKYTPIAKAPSYPYIKERDAAAKPYAYPKANAEPVPNAYASVIGSTRTHPSKSYPSPALKPRVAAPAAGSYSYPQTKGYAHDMKRTVPKDKPSSTTTPTPTPSPYGKTHTRRFILPHVPLDFRAATRAAAMA